MRPAHRWSAALLAAVLGPAMLWGPIRAAPYGEGAVASEARIAYDTLPERSRAGVRGAVATSCQGRVRGYVTNRTDRRVVATIHVGKRVHRVSVGPGRDRRFVEAAPERARVVLRSQTEVLDRARVPRRCISPADFPTPRTVGPRRTPTATYDGGCVVTQDDLVIEGVIINCQVSGLVMGNVNGDAAPDRSVRGVVIRNAIVNGGVFTSFAPTDPQSEDDSHPRIFSVVSSRVVNVPGMPSDRAVGAAHFLVRDSYLQGSHSAMWAHNKVVIKNSYITTDGTDSHQSGLRMLKNSILRGNTIRCRPLAGSTGNDTSGCSASAVFYREFGVPTNLTIDRNYFPYDPARGGGYFATRFVDCQVHDDCTDIKMVRNLFDRGQGTDGAEFPDDAGDVWADNWWTDGRPAHSGQSR